MPTIKKNNTVKLQISNLYSKKKLIIISLLTILTIYIISCLISFNVDDPSWTTISTDTYVNNYMGISGAYISGFILSIFGVYGFIIPLFIINVIKYFFLKKENENINYLKLTIKTIGLIAIILGICGLSQIYLKILTPHLPEYSGGIIGYEITRYLHIYLNENHMILSLLIIVFCGILFYLGDNLFELLKYFFISNDNVSTNQNNISLNFEDFNKKTSLDKINKKNNSVNLENMSKKITDNKIETINI